MLQHAIGIAYHEKQLYIADTYNNKIKVINAETGETKSIAGTGKPGKDDAAGTFDEPAGLAFAKGTLYVADTNNHLIRKVDPKTGKVSTMTITGLTPPKIVPRKKVAKIRFPKAPVVPVKANVKPSEGKVSVAVELQWPDGWKTNELAKMGYFLFLKDEDGVVDRTKISTEKISLAAPTKSFSFQLPVAKNGSDSVRVEVPFFYCEEGDSGVCKYGQVAYEIDLTVSDSGSDKAVLKYQVPN